jgi:hypothetical protein
VVSLKERPNSSKSHCAKSLSRQRTTPWTAGMGGRDLRQRLTRLGIELGPLAWRLALDQPVWAVGIEAQHPVANGLQANASDAGRIRARRPHRSRRAPAASARLPQNQNEAHWLSSSRTLLVRYKESEMNPFGKPMSHRPRKLV